MQVERWNFERDGPLSEPGLRHKLEGLGSRGSRHIDPPGTHFAMRAHATDKIDAVVSGHFRITMGAEEVLLGAGDAVYVPSGVEHSAGLWEMTPWPPWTR